MAQPDEIDSGKLAFIGIVSVICVIGIALLVQVLYYKKTSELNQTYNIEHQNRALSKYVTEQREKLTGYRWVDKQAQVASIPIEQAMELVVRDIRARRQPAEARKDDKAVRKPSEPKRL